MVGALSKFWGVSGSEDRGGGDSSISSSIFLGGWVTKVLKNGDKNRGGGGKRAGTTIF